MSRAEGALLPELRDRIRRIERPAATVHGVLPFGIMAIDRALPGGGLARGAVHEILGASGDEEDGALAAAFAAGMLGRLVSPTSPSQSLTRPGPSLSPLKGGEGLSWRVPTRKRATVSIGFWVAERPTRSSGCLQRAARRSSEMLR